MSSKRHNVSSVSSSFFDPEFLKNGPEFSKNCPKVVNWDFEIAKTPSFLKFDPEFLQKKGAEFFFNPGFFFNPDFFCTKKPGLDSCRMLYYVDVVAVSHSRYGKGNKSQ